MKDTWLINSLVPRPCAFVACSMKFVQISYCKRRTRRAWERGQLIRTLTKSQLNTYKSPPKIRTCTGGQQRNQVSLLALVPAPCQDFALGMESLNFREYFASVQYFVTLTCTGQFMSESNPLRSPQAKKGTITLLTPVKSFKAPTQGQWDHLK